MIEAYIPLEFWSISDSLNSIVFGTLLSISLCIYIDFYLVLVGFFKTSSSIYILLLLFSDFRIVIAV